MFFFKKKLSSEEQGREGKALISSVLSIYKDSKVNDENPVIRNYNRALDLQVHMRDFEDADGKYGGDYTSIFIYYGKNANHSDVVASCFWSFHKGFEWNTYDSGSRYMNVILALANMENISRKFFEQVRDSIIDGLGREQGPLSDNDSTEITNYSTYIFELSQREETTSIRLENAQLLFSVNYDEQSRWSTIRVFDEYSGLLGEKSEEGDFRSRLIYEFRYKYGMYEALLHVKNIKRLEMYSYIWYIHFSLRELFDESEKKSGDEEIMEIIARNPYPRK